MTERCHSSHRPAVDAEEPAAVVVCGEPEVCEVRGRRFDQYQSDPGGPESDSHAAVTDAVKVLRAAADQGDSKAQVALGTLYACGHGVPKDAVLGLRWLRRAAESGSRYAQIKLVEAHAVGGRRAERWLRAGAAEGDAHAMTVLGLSCSRGDLAGGWSEAVAWWRRAAALGCATAQQHLGCAYLQGSGVAANRAEALRLLRLAEAQGRQHAGAILASLGEADPQAPTATEVLHTAALLGDAQAQFDLACAYAEGEDGPDGDGAVRFAWWLRLTSPGRTACGQHEVLERNLDEAITCLRQAAAAGLAEAQCNLAVAYLRGLGVEADSQHAVSLLHAAAASGHAAAGLYLLRLGAGADSGDSAGGLGHGAGGLLRQLAPSGPGDSEEERSKGGGDAAAGDEPKARMLLESSSDGCDKVNEGRCEDSSPPEATLSTGGEATQEAVDGHLGLVEGVLTTPALAERLRREALPCASPALLSQGPPGLQDMTALAAVVLATAMAGGPRDVRELLAMASEHAQSLLACDLRADEFPVRSLRQLQHLLPSDYLGALEELHSSMGIVLYILFTGKDDAQETARWLRHQQRYQRRRPLAGPGPGGSCGVPGRPSSGLVQAAFFDHGGGDEAELEPATAEIAAVEQRPLRRGTAWEACAPAARFSGAWVCHSLIRVGGAAPPARVRHQEHQAGGADSAAGEAPWQAA